MSFNVLKKSDFWILLVPFYFASDVPFSLFHPYFFIYFLFPEWIHFYDVQDLLTRLLIQIVGQLL